MNSKNQTNKKYISSIFLRIFSIILLMILLISVTSAASCKPRKNDNNLSETQSEIENESSIDGAATEGKMYAVTDSWYRYKTVNKLVAEVYEKERLVVKNEYDSDGYRIKKTAGDTVTTFKYDKEYQLIKEVCISNKAETHTLNYTYELQYSDVKGPKYKLTGFTYNGKAYTFKTTNVRGIITAIYEGDTCVAEYERENNLLKAVYELKNGEKVKNEEPDFIGNLNRVLSENQYFYDDETGMFLDKYLIWHSAYGNMSYYDREYETPENTTIIWTPSNGDKYVYNDKNDIEKVINGDKVITEYIYEAYIYCRITDGVEVESERLSKKITDGSVIKYEYFSGNEDILKENYFMSDLYIIKNRELIATETEDFYKGLQSVFKEKLKSITVIMDGKEHKFTYKYGYPIEDEDLGQGFTSLSVSGFSYNGRTYKFEFADYDSYYITGIIDDNGNKIVSYKFENEGNIYYNRKTYEIKDGVEVENNSPDFIGNLNLVIRSGGVYDSDCKVNFGTIMYK